MINDMENIEDVVLLFDQVFGKDDIVGEKDFFEFMKRANRDLTAKQGYIILRITINALRGANDE